MNSLYIPPIKTFSDYLESLGNIPASRLRFKPTPGTATIDDLLKPENEGCELVDGALVEKPVGQEESFFAMELAYFIMSFLKKHKVGFITGEQGFTELTEDTVRAPDIAFFSWNRLPDRRRPKEKIPHLAPDLAVEILSESNSAKEMTRKRGEYFQAGTKMVWEVDTRTKKFSVYTDVDTVKELGVGDTLDGGDVLPGFTLELTVLFAELDEHG